MSEELIIPIILEPDDVVASGELYMLSVRLREELLNQPVSSVEFGSVAVSKDGKKGLGPNETQLFVALASYVVPALILFLSNWLLRQKDYRLHIKIGEAEVDIPPNASLKQTEQIVKILTEAVKHTNKAEEKWQENSH